MIIIKKEKDRKYYDSHKKKYVTLTELSHYLINGQKIKVINYQNQDITNKTIVSIFSKITNPQILNQIVSKANNLSILNNKFKEEIKSLILEQALNKTKEGYSFAPSSAPFIMQIYIDLAYSI